MSTRALFRFLEGIYGAFYSPQGISRLTRVVEEEVRIVLHAARDALNKERKQDREALAQDLKAVYRAETEQEAKEALGRLRERWGKIYPRVVAR